MKFCALNKTLVAAALSACAASVAFSPAQAQQLSQTPVIVTFSGEMTDFSCTPSVNGGNPVVLEPASLASALAVGDTTGETPFTVQIICDHDLPDGGDKLTRTIKAYFYANHVTDGRLNLTSGTGAGWQYQLLTGYDQLNVQTSPTPSNNENDKGTQLGWSGGIPYTVRYYRSSNDFNAGTGITTANVVLYWP